MHACVGSFVLCTPMFKESSANTLVSLNTNMDKMG